MSKTINELDTVTTLALTDAMHLFQSGVDYKTTIDTIADLILANTSKIPFMHIEDRPASSTAGGTFTLGAWRVRDLSTEVTNTITGASLSSNQITLPIGTYYIEGSAPAFAVNQHNTRLQNTTDASTDLSGSSEYASAGSSVQTRSFFKGRVTIAGIKVFEIQHRSAATKADNGLGVDSGTSFAVAHEVYAEIKIWKLA